jgi:hypothetical protein
MPAECRRFGDNLTGAGRNQAPAPFQEKADMNPYRASLADMQFVMTELAGLGDVAALPGYEEAGPDTVGAVVIFKRAPWSLAVAVAPVPGGGCGSAIDAT